MTFKDIIPLIREEYAKDLKDRFKTDVENIKDDELTNYIFATGYNCHFRKRIEQFEKFEDNIQYLFEICKISIGGEERYFKLCGKSYSFTSEMWNLKPEHIIEVKPVEVIVTEWKNA